MFRRLFFPYNVLSRDEIRLVLRERTLRDRSLGIRENLTYDIFPLTDDTYMGYVSLRVGESPEIYYLGHIGYRVEEPFRGHGYAGQAVRAMLPVIRSFGFQTLTITTDKDNLPSRKTCEQLGCVLESIVPVPYKYRPLCMNSPAKCRYILIADEFDAERINK